MASRKEQKEQARARRLAEERARVAQVRRTRRMQMIGGTVAVVVVLIAVGIAISSANSGPGGPGLQHGKAGTRTAQAVNSLLTGIPQSGTVLGNPNAPVTMVYYGDLECPICRQFTLSGGFPQLVTDQVRPGHVKVVYHAFCTATCNGPGPSVFITQQAAALAAGEQNRFWDYAELFYHEQGQEGTNYVTSGYLLGLAQQVSGLNIGQWQSRRTAAALSAEVQSQEQQGTSAGITGTPTLVLTGPTGKRSTLPEAVPSYANILQAIKHVT